MNAIEFTTSLKRLKQSLPQFAPEFDRETVSLWFDFFKDVPHETFANACRKAVENEVSFPPVAKLRRYCGIGDDPNHDREKATEIAERCWGAVRKFGWPNPKPAEEFVGPIGWAAIQLSGGWVPFTESANDDQQSALLAQLRDLVLNLLHKQRAGIDLMAIPGVQDRGPDKLPPVTQDALKIAMGRSNDVVNNETPERLSKTP